MSLAAQTCWIQFTPQVRARVSCQLVMAEEAQDGRNSEACLGTASSRTGLSRPQCSSVTNQIMRVMALQVHCCPQPSSIQWRQLLLECGSLAGQYSPQEFQLHFLISCLVALSPCPFSALLLWLQGEIGRLEQTRTCLPRHSLSCSPCPVFTPMGQRTENRLEMLFRFTT